MITERQDESRESSSSGKPASAFFRVFESASGISSISVRMAQSNRSVPAAMRTGLSVCMGGAKLRPSRLKNRTPCAVRLAVSPSLSTYAVWVNSASAGLSLHR